MVWGAESVEKSKDVILKYNFSVEVDEEFMRFYDEAKKIVAFEESKSIKRKVGKTRGSTKCQRKNHAY